MINTSFFQKHVVIVGKGPTFKRQKIMNEKTVIALNTAAIETECNFIHLIDFDVYEKIRDVLLVKTINLIIPLYPHIDNNSTNKNVFELLGDDEVFNEIVDEKRVLLYNLENSNRFIEGYPIVSNSYFSAEVVVKLVCQFNISKITLIGVDGGYQYSKCFDKKTLLANGHESFDIQFKGIQLATYKSNVELNHISYPEPILVNINCFFNNKIAFDVFYYSILCKSTIPFRIKTYCEEPTSILHFKADVKKSIKKEDLINNFNSKELYCRSEMLVLEDFKNILKSSNKEGITDLPTLFTKLKNDNNKQVLFIDFFNISKQPWLIRGANNYEGVWMKYLIKGIEDRFIIEEDIKREIIEGNVRPSLWFQIRNEDSKSIILNWWVKLLDKYFHSIRLANKPTFFIG